MIIRYLTKISGTGSAVIWYWGYSNTQEVIGI